MCECIVHVLASSIEMRCNWRDDAASQIGRLQRAGDFQPIVSARLGTRQKSALGHTTCGRAKKRFAVSSQLQREMRFENLGVRRVLKRDAAADRLTS